MNVATAEALVFEKLVPELESEGYDVFVHPSKDVVPRFLRSYQPDLIALRNDKNLVFEIKTTSNTIPSKDTEALTKLFEGQDKWELRVIWVASRQDRQDPELQSDESISERLDEISRMLTTGFDDSALLLCWATFEAVGRRLMREQFLRPQTPAQLVQGLANEGYVTPDEADFLRIAASARNRLIHGELSARFSRDDVKTFLTILQSLAELALTPSPSM